MKLESKIIKCPSCEKESEMEQTGWVEGPNEIIKAYQCPECEVIVSIQNKKENKD